jgi:hypothetical protein
VFLRKAYSILLRLYPHHFRTQFGGEMIQVFEQAIVEQRKGSRLDLVVFLVREMLGLLAAAAGARLRQGRKEAAEPVFPSDIAGAEKYVVIMSQQVIGAIANHDFPKARLYDQQDRRARALLARLRRESAG